MTIRLWPPCSARGIHLGLTPAGKTMKMNGRRKTQMCILGTRPKRSKEAESDRYRRFEIAKRHIPQNMLPKEYEEEIKRLARKYKI